MLKIQRNRKKIQIWGVKWNNKKFISLSIELKSIFDKNMNLALNRIVQFDKVSFENIQRAFSRMILID